jgi:cephalosporin-C deacetylase
MHQFEEETFLKLGYIDLHHLAPRIESEVIMVTGMRDNICPPSTQFAVFNHLTTKKTHHLYPEHGHEYIPHHADEAFQFFKKL